VNRKLAKRAAANEDDGQGTEDRRFDLGRERVGDVQRWALSFLPEACLVRDDLVIVLGELLGNVVVHGGGGEVTVTLTHGGGELVGNLVHHRPPSLWVSEVPEEIGGEVAALLDSEEADDALIELLADGGRGLFCVAALTEDALQTHRYEERTVLRWVHRGCRCGRQSP